MVRKIIQIDEKKCNGCGLCASACHESAIVMVGGKAKLLRDDYCDGLGDCLPTCPTGAISFVEREAAGYDHQAVMDHKTYSSGKAKSHLRQWPVQIKLAPVHAPYFEKANLLIAADCSAYAFGSFHTTFMHNRITLIGCPKLDGVNYSEKLSSILKSNNINSITVVRMEVPCCGGIEIAAKQALEESGNDLPLQVVTISTDGQILSL